MAGSFGLHADLELGAAGLKLQQKGSMSPLQPEGCRGMQEESDKWPAKANGVSGAQPVNMECDLPQRQGNGWARHGGGQGAGTGPARPGTAPLQPWPVQQHLLQQQPPQQQQAPAAEAGTPKAAPLAAAGEVPPDESQLAMAELEAILTRISQLDAEGWFQAPVSEADAPRYYSIIKQPMCFAVGGWWWVGGAAADGRLWCAALLLPEVYERSSSASCLAVSVLGRRGVAVGTWQQHPWQLLPVGSRTRRPWRSRHPVVTCAARAGHAQQDPGPAVRELAGGGAGL